MPSSFVLTQPHVRPCCVPAPLSKRPWPFWPQSTNCSPDRSLKSTRTSSQTPKVFPNLRKDPKHDRFSHSPDRLVSGSPSGPGICVITVICVISRERERVLRHGSRRLRHGKVICVMGHQLNCIDLHRFALVRAAHDGRGANGANSGDVPGGHRCSRKLYRMPTLSN
jgi:hypothetical protein